MWEDRYSLRKAIEMLITAQDKLERNWMRLYPEVEMDEEGRYWQTDTDMESVREGIWETLRALGMEGDYPDAKYMEGR